MFNFNNFINGSKDFKENTNFKFPKFAEVDNGPTFNKFKKCKIIDVNNNTYEGLYSRNKRSTNNDYNYKYYIRSDETEENFTVEPFAIVNFYGLFFTNTEIKFSEREDSYSEDRLPLKKKDEYIEVKSLEFIEDSKEE